MPLGRIVVGKQTLLDFGDEFDEVAELIDAAISVASQDQLFPAEFPRNAIPLFTEFRKDPRHQRCLFVQARNRE